MKHTHALFVHTLIGLALALGITTAQAHGDEDHDHGPAAATAAPTVANQAPRASTQTDAFELVAMLQSDAAPVLLLYIDDADTNAPVRNAEVELESGTVKARAKPIEPGVYALPAGALVKPGSHPLTVSIQVEAQADLLTTTLTVPAPQAEHANQDQATPRPTLRWAVAGTLGAAVLITLGWHLGRKT